MNVISTETAHCIRVPLLFGVKMLYFYARARAVVEGAICEGCKQVGGGVLSLGDT